MLLIYSEEDGPRLRYISEELVGRRMRMEYRLVFDRAELDAFDGPKICYAAQPAGDALHIKPCGLLHEKGLTPQQVAVKEAKWWRHYFFETSGAAVPFDVLAAAFWLLSRYEEYHTDAFDTHGRFDHQASLAYQKGFLEIPLVDTWATELCYQLGKQFPDVQQGAGNFRFLSTIDIDFAYRYLGIGLMRQFKKWGRAVMQFRFSDAITQLRCVLGFEKDPYDTYSFIQHVCEESRIDLQYFVLMNTGNAFDKNINTGDPLMAQLLKRLAKQHQLGIHPSYYSMEQPMLVTAEKNRLQAAAGVSVTHSRQHYLRFRLAAGYRALLAAGIVHDYSMGYSTACGFRAGTALPFRFYDLEEEQLSCLTVHPVACMDTALRFGMQLNAGAAMKKIEQLMNEVQKVSGTFISIWHNSNLGREDGWKEWREVFEKMHTLAGSKQHEETD